jgi:membrane protease YdiL (CAAX protease family)
MSDLSTDRAGRMIAWPIFFPLPTPETRSVWRALAALALFLLFGVGATFLAGVAAPAVAVVFVRLGGGATTYADAVAWMTTLGAIETHDLREELMLLAVLGAVFTAWTGALIAALKITHPHQPVKRWITSARRFRWRLFLAGGGLFGVVMAGALGLTMITAPGTLAAPIFDVSQDVQLRLAYAGVLFLVLPVAAAFEEILCRGWLVQQTAAWTRNIFVILTLNAVIFSALHLDPDPGRNLSRMVVGVAFAWGALRLGGLEFSIGAHTVNNLMIALFASTLGKATEVAQASKVGDVVTDLCTTAAMIAAIELAARWTPLHDWAGVEGGGRGSNDPHAVFD